jgi:hypothetical protein
VKDQLLRLRDGKASVRKLYGLSSAELLDAIHSRFRLKVAIEGAVAEFQMAKHIERAVRKGIERFEQLPSVKRWFDGATSGHRMANNRSPRKRMSCRHYIFVSEKGWFIDESQALMGARTFYADGRRGSREPAVANISSIKVVRSGDIFS